MCVCVCVCGVCVRVCVRTCMCACVSTGYICVLGIGMFIIRVKIISMTMIGTPRQSHDTPVAGSQCHVTQVHPISAMTSSVHHSTPDTRMEGHVATDHCGGDTYIIELIQ